MTKKILALITFISFGVVGSSIIISNNSALAINPFDKSCAGHPDTEICNGKSEKLDNGIKGIINILLWAVGIISVIVIIISGIMYITSIGDPGKVTKAKNALLYSVVGLVVALMAYAIVNFVLGKF